MLVSVVIALLFVSLIGAIPAWPYNQSWGYFPSLSLGMSLIIVVLLLLGRF